jgi:hypothetical protein
LHSTKWRDGKKKQKWTPLSSVGNEENGYPVPDLHKTITNVTKEPSDTNIKTLKEEILEEISEKFLTISV